MRREILETPAEITNLLQQWSAGDSYALEQVLPLVYGQLRDIARRQMRGERPAHTLQATVTIEFDEACDFSKYKTYALHDGRIHSNDPSLNNDLVIRKIEALIRKGLTERGLTEAKSRPDLNVRYSLGRPGRNAVHTERILTVNLKDARKRELVWQATAIERKNDPEKIRAALGDMVRKSFEKYPPNKK